MQTRPPERVTPILQLLERAWRHNSDLRLGQVIANASQRDPFYVEDDDMIVGLRALAFQSLARFLGSYFHEDHTGSIDDAVLDFLVEGGPDEARRVHDDLTTLLARDEDETVLLSFVASSGAEFIVSRFGQVQDWLRVLEATLSRSLADHAG